MLSMDIELAYLAGFFDGEGHISVVKSNNRHTLVVSVSQLDPTPLIVFQGRFGGGVIRQPDKRGYRQMIVWNISAVAALEFLETIRPYLKVRGEQADLGIEFQKYKHDWNDRAEEIERRDDLHERLRSLKFRTYDHIELPTTVLRERMSSARRLETVVRNKTPKPPPSIRHKVAEPIHSEGYQRGKRPNREELAAKYAELGANDAIRFYRIGKGTFYNWLNELDIPRIGRTAESETRRIEAVKKVWVRPEPS